MDHFEDQFLCPQHSQTSNSTEINSNAWMNIFSLRTLSSLPRKQQIFYLLLIKFFNVNMTYMETEPDI